jgi:hypothetical protein
LKKETVTSKVRNRESNRLGERVEGWVVEGYGEGLKLFLSFGKVEVSGLASFAVWPPSDWLLSATSGWPPVRSIIILIIRYMPHAA